MSAGALGAALKAAQAQLAQVSDSPRVDAELLMAQITGFSRAQLLTRLQHPLTADDAAQFSAAVARRVRGEPIAYILGEQPFWNVTLRVTPDVLVPRADTEVLVEWALECVHDVMAPRMIDLGTGSGAIALALASERSDAHIDATDVSIAALAVAQDNAERLGLRHVHFVQAHWWQALPAQRYALVVANPPYIADGDVHLAALRYEPVHALTDGADGLSALREIIAGAGQYLSAQGWLLLEHGYDQAAAVRELLSKAGFVAVTTRQDYGGHDRVSGGRWP